MSPKLEKVAAEIARLKDRITRSQERLKELERLRTEVENTEIVEMVRLVEATPEELAAFIRAYRTHKPLPPLREESLSPRGTDSTEFTDDLEPDKE